MRKKPSLRDLSIDFIEAAHLPEIFHELDSQTDRGVGLIAAALLDDYLKKAMRTRLADIPNFDEIMFGREGAPLHTFSARIKIARALNVIGPLSEGHLEAIRKIRNQFAHSVLKIDFSHPLIAAECEKLLPDSNPERKPQFSSQRRRFIGTVLLMCQAFEAQFESELGNEIRSGLP
ncbi:MAG: hypothetical protein C0429_00510 [Sphingopyxis sp.]|nr:hypothetical protein [Sphingopyxis sp.]